MIECRNKADYLLHNSATNLTSFRNKLSRKLSNASDIENTIYFIELLKIQ